MTLFSEIHSPKSQANIQIINFTHLLKISKVISRIDRGYPRQRYPTPFEYYLENIYRKLMIQIKFMEFVFHIGFAVSFFLSTVSTCEGFNRVSNSLETSAKYNKNNKKEDYLSTHIYIHRSYI